MDDGRWAMRLYRVSSIVYHQTAFHLVQVRYMLRAGCGTNEPIPGDSASGFSAAFLR
jgi:hypothetical protein